MKSLHDAMLDPDLFGRTFGGPTFWAWRTIAKFLDGMPLEPLELKLWQEITSREAPPSGAFSEAYLIKPRRSGGAV
jgi:hypothetical protein